MYFISRYAESSIDKKCHPGPQTINCTAVFRYKKSKQQNISQSSQEKFV